MSVSIHGTADDTQTETDVFTFTIILSGVVQIDDDLEKRVFESGCDDALLGMRNGETFLSFDRRAESFHRALVTAVRDVEKAGLSVSRVEPTEATTMDHVNSILDLRRAPNVADMANEIWRMLLSQYNGQDSA